MNNSPSSPSACGFPWSIIRKSSAPSKVSFYAWEVSEGKILMYDNLQKRGKISVNRCLMCKSELKTRDHLLLHCPFARNVWDLAWFCLGLHWVVESTGKYQLLAWEGFFGRKAKNRGFSVIPHAIFWILWTERNRRVFDGVETLMEQLKDKWLKILFVWKEEVLCSYSIDTVDFVDGLFLML